MQIKKPTPKTKVRKVGIDAGYGETKLVAEGVAFTFPSVAGYARRVKFGEDELAIRYPGEQITDEADSWFVGNLAQSQLKAGELFKMRGRGGEGDSLGIEFRKRLIRVALGKWLAQDAQADEIVRVRLATGLPVQNMGDADAMKAALLGQHRINTDQNDFIVDIVHVHVIPQPVGALYSQTLLPNGELNPCHTAVTTVVVDPGKYTIDLAYDRDGEYIDSRSGSTAGGVFNVDERIFEMLKDELDDEPSYADVERVLRYRKLRINNIDVDFTTEVEQFLAPLTTATLQLMTEKIGRGKTADKIIVVGGGASLVFDEVSQNYPVAEMPDNPQLLIAQGFYNYAVHEDM